MARRHFIDFVKLREVLDFPSVLEHYGITLESDRKQAKISCPFHEDSTPSCSINIEKGIFKCFGCEAKGNVLDFMVRMADGEKGNPEDLYAAALLGISILGREPREFAKSDKDCETPKTAPRRSQKRKPASTSSDGKKSSPGKPERPSDVSKSETESNPVLDLQLDLDPGHPFLSARDISPELAEKYGLGFCKAGLMKDRIAIPIHNAAGELVAYAGRYADEELPANTERYRLPKKFHKSLELYNLHRAAQLKKSYIVLVEGYWSAIRLNEAGIPVAALMGTSVSEEQAALIKAQGFKFATLLLDGDDPGRKAAVEAAYQLSREVYVHIITLPDGVKPDTIDDTMLDRLRR